MTGTPIFPVTCAQGIPVAIKQGFIARKCNGRASNFFMLNWRQTNMAEIESRATGATFAEISKLTCILVTLHDTLLPKLLGGAVSVAAGSATMEASV